MKTLRVSTKWWVLFLSMLISAPAFGIKGKIVRGAIDAAESALELVERVSEGSRVPRSRAEDARNKVANALEVAEQAGVTSPHYDEAQALRARYGEVAETHAGYFDGIEALPPKAGEEAHDAEMPDWERQLAEDLGELDGNS